MFCFVFSFRFFFFFFASPLFKEENRVIFLYFGKPWKCFCSSKSIQCCDFRESATHCNAKKHCWSDTAPIKINLQFYNMFNRNENCIRIHYYIYRSMCAQIVNHTTLIMQLQKCTLLLLVIQHDMGKTR